MAFDSIKAGLRVFTNARISSKGGTLGGSEGVIATVTRHPVTRAILFVVLDAGTDDPGDNIVVSPRNLRAVTA